MPDFQRSIPTALYILRDPWTNRIRYLGLSCKPWKRLTEHLRLARIGGETRLPRWIRKVLRNDGAPVLSVLEWCPDKISALVAERRWIRRLRSHDVQLVNMTDGGEGILNVTAESRRKISQSQKGRTAWCKGLTKETDDRVMRRAKAIGAALKGKSTWPRGLTSKDDERIARRARNLRRTFMSGHHPNSKLTVDDVRFIRAHQHLRVSEFQQ